MVLSIASDLRSVVITLGERKAKWGERAQDVRASRTETGG